MQHIFGSYAYGELGESRSCGTESDFERFSGDAFCKPQVGGSIPLASSNLSSTYH